MSIKRHNIQQVKQSAFETCQVKTAGNKVLHILI